MSDQCPAHPAKKPDGTPSGSHYWIWKKGELGKVKRCPTCGQERPVKRFEGQ